MPEDNINEIFSNVIRKWRTADSQRMIFGTNMPQTKSAVRMFLECLQEAFKMSPSFSLVKKDQAMEIVVKLKGANKDSAETNIPVNFPSMPKVFDELKINSITIKNGVTEEEMLAFFTGMSLGSKTKEQGGLKGYLQAQKISHIDIDQMKFKLLKDDDKVTESGAGTGTGKGAGKGEGKGAGKGAGTGQESAGEGVKGGAGSGTMPSGTAKKRAPLTAKERDSAWTGYFEEEIAQENFEGQYNDVIREAVKDPKQLEKVLKRVVTKKKEPTKFFARLAQKLFSLGFSDDAVEDIKKKVLKPKKILVEEDELARLRNIEQEYLKTAGQDMEEISKTVNTIKRKLTDETARNEAMMHHMGHGGMTLNAKGEIISVNDTARKVLGLREEDVIGKTVKDILKPHHLLTSVSDWQNETEDHTPNEITVKTLSDETLAIIRESAIVIENETGRSIGVLSALHHVTQQEELNRRKNDILDVLGHDLRSPLSAIKMNFDILAESTKLDIEGSEQQKKFLSNCQSSITRMQRLIEKVLDMRQLETGKIMLKYDTIQTDSLLEQAVNAQGDWAKKKNITLSINAPSLPDIDGDPERLYQIITNLVSNAVKFTPEGGTITAEGKVVQKEGVDYIEITVKDSGMGIPKDKLTKIFDKYEQVTVNAPQGVRGLGLGLSICKTIVELHGGNIWADSELDKGSAFTFQVPVKRKTDEVTDQA